MSEALEYEEARFAPVKEGASDDEKAGAAGLTLVALLTAIASAVVLVEAHHVKKDEFYRFTVYSLHVLDSYPYMQNLVNGTFVVSLALFFSSFVTATAGVLRKPKPAKFGLVAIFISAVFVLTGGIITLNFVGDIDGDVNNEQPVLSGPNRELLDFSIAMYEKCCLRRSYVDAFVSANLWPFLEADDIEDSLRDIQTCQEHFSGNKDYSSPQVRLASCIGNRDHLQWFLNATDEDFICGMFNSTDIDIVGFEIQGYSLEQLTLGAQAVNIAGPASRPEYGCGGGMIKAFQLVVYIWFRNTIMPVGSVLVGAGIVSILAAFFGLASLCLTSSTTEMTIDRDLIDAYLNRDMEPTSSAIEVGVTRPARPANVVGVAPPQNVDNKI